jgi:hypothetical protein
MDLKRVRTCCCLSDLLQGTAHELLICWTPFLLLLLMLLHLHRGKTLTTCPFLVLLLCVTYRAVILTARRKKKKKMQVLGGVRVPKCQGLGIQGQLFRPPAIRARMCSRPLAGAKVEARDFPAPNFDNEATYQEAAGLANKLKSAPRPVKPRRVIIAGAGLAGLAAAKYLSDAGHIPVVLEARDVLGGKVGSFLWRACVVYAVVHRCIHLGEGSPRLD